MPPQPFDKCYIGSSPRTTVETSFCGQMSSISLFGDCLPNTTISALYRLGADYKVRSVTWFVTSFYVVRHVMSRGL